ncbi:cilia- and flagella-associated protein 45 isoform X1 [Carcharodon carcharias]|uniref:cilia- and flagella-associated protein 45 isoform X1 n=2 Tax=Carcharodon carcharias TaxID=13397 RepID=UPI001B7E4306|nr:cilia- and flagella-associated protein 45 isoform X1 [Carcharodon carcharias]
MSACPGTCGSEVQGTSSTSLSRSRRYRTKASNSQVDETLFGNRLQKSHPATQVSAEFDPCSDQVLGKLLYPAPNKSKPKESIRLITKDIIRDLIIPTEDPSGKTLIMSPDEFERIKQASHVISEEERESMRVARNGERMQAAEMAGERKSFMRTQELQRRKNEKLNEVEEAARDRALYLLEKANTLRLEQEDEIKQINETITDARCHAIRDAQILEKEQIEKEMLEEEKRLDKMMEVDRQKAIKMQDELERIRKENGLRAKAHIIQQIEEREQERMLQLEHKALQAMERVQAMEKMQQEDLENLQEKRRQQRRRHQEIKESNEQVQRHQELMQEQDRQADQKVREFQDAKMKREAEFEEQHNRLKREKAIEVARLQALQKRAHDHKAEQDALRAKRSQEATEREWRRKELEDKRKKAEVLATLKKSRSDQIRQKQHFLVVQATKERQEFERVLKVQKEQIEKEKKEEEDKRYGRTKYASDLREQIIEREQNHIAERAAFFEEGKHLKEEAYQRRLRLDQIKRKKLEELRSVGLPEKYCREIERRLAAVTA